MREPWNWEKEDLEELIGQMESTRLDFKQSRLLNESQRHKIIRNLCREVAGFANTEGGTVVVGIAERREGKARIADGIDEGVEIDKWGPEQLQQMIESNISPYLPGIRLKRVILDAAKTKRAYVIFTPQGSTAYQVMAGDFRYYGRSEYETKALPDHEIRLRMFRGRQASATVRVTNCKQKDTIGVTAVEAQEKYGKKQRYNQKLWMA